MKLILLLALLLVTIWSSPAHAQSRDHKRNSHTGTEAEVLNAADRFYDAFLAGDIETVKRMTADDYLQTDVNGRVQDKAAWLAEYYEPIVRRMKAGAQMGGLRRSDIQVRRYGDVAVLIGRTTLKGSGGGSEVARELRFTQVWVKRHGQWQRAVFHNAYLPESK